MLSVSGLQAALKRRIKDQSGLALTGPAARRFSSGEVLSSQLQNLPAPNVATVARRSSFSRRVRKVSTGNSQPEVLDSCTVLDIHIAQIKRKLVSTVRT